MIISEFSLEEMVEAYHYPVMYREVLELLDIKNRRVVVDCTTGVGAHSHKILESASSQVQLIGIDRDQDSLDAAQQRLKAFEGRFSLIKDDFSNIDKILRKLNQKIMIKTNNLDNNDIFAKLSKPKKVSSNVIGELKDKFNLDNWIFTQVDDLTIGTLIKYIDLNKKSISEECFIKEIIYNTNKTIKTIKVVIRNTELEKKSKYYWKINPQKYYIFKHPNSMMIAFTDML